MSIYCKNFEAFQGNRNAFFVLNGKQGGTACVVEPSPLSIFFWIDGCEGFLERR